MLEPDRKEDGWGGGRDGALLCSSPNPVRVDEAALEYDGKVVQDAVRCPNK